jgi:hypothetical protein
VTLARFPLHSIRILDFRFAIFDLKKFFANSQKLTANSRQSQIKNRKSKFMDELFQAMPALLRAAGESEEILEAAAFAAWRRVSGEALRGTAVPFRLYRKTLVVSVPDATWRKQLEEISPQLLFRLNSLLGQALVTYIEFRVDPQTVSEERARLRRSQYERLVEEENALSRAVELDEAASAIHDDELRRRFLLAAGSCLNRREE